MFIYVLDFLYCIPLKELKANNRFWKVFRVVITNSAVLLRLWKRRVRDLIETIESISEVSLTPQKPNFSKIIYDRKYRYISEWKTWCKSIYKGSEVSLKPRNLLPRSHWNCWILFCGLNETAESASAVTLTPQKPMISNDYLEFLSKFESIFKTALAHESEPKWGIVCWKNRVSKISLLKW
jgi:hypothetical protein